MSLSLRGHSIWLLPLLVLLTAPACQPGEGMEVFWEDGMELLSATPPKGPSSGGEQILLKGRGFSPDSTVTIRGLAAPVVAAQSGQELVVTLPARPGALGPAPITVNNPDGSTVTRADLFSYYLGNTAIQAPVSLLQGQQIIQSLVVLDADRDGRPDLITLERPEGTLSATTQSTLVTNLGSESGSFVARPQAAVVSTQRTQNLLSGDFNGDGIPDLLHLARIQSTSPQGLQAKILLGTGDGSFTESVTLELPRFASFNSSPPVVSDINGDGRTDLLVVEPNPTSGFDIEIFLGQADGTLRFDQSLNLPTAPGSASIRDVDGDKLPDIVLRTAVMSVTRVLVYSGRTDGTFAQTAATSLVTTDSISEITVDDVNRDRLLDLITLDTKGVLALRLGNLNGLFDSPIPFATPGYMPKLLNITDINQDGRADLSLSLSILSGTTTNTVALGVLLGNGDGSFGALQVTQTGRILTSVQYADVDGDGQRDLLYLGTRGKCFSARGLGDGRFASFSQTPTGVPFINLIAADFDGDQAEELVADCSSVYACGTGTGVGVISRSVAGALDQLRFLSTGLNSPPSPGALGAADFDQDGKNDLIMLGSPLAATWLGLGDGAFLRPRLSIVPVACGSFHCMVLADLNRDSLPDLVSAVSSQARVAMGSGDGYFESPASYPTGAGAKAVAVLDLDRDGNLDLVTASPSSFSLGVLLGHGDGTFEPAQYVSLTLAPDYVDAGDVDGDGLTDLVIASNATNDLAVLRGQRDGRLGALEYFGDSGTSGTRMLQLVDLNGDGAPEILLVTGRDPNVVITPPPLDAVLRIYLNAGDGTYPRLKEYDVGPNLGAAAALDLDRDGKIDLALADPQRISIDSLRNTSW